LLLIGVQYFDLLTPYREPFMPDEIESTGLDKPSAQKKPPEPEPRPPHDEDAPFRDDGDDDEDAV
jgi:hypothetical protein